MTRSLLNSALCILIMSATVIAQEPVDTGESSALTVEEYNDTWGTPYITDEMTLDPEQNKAWRMGDYKYPAKPKNSWEFGIHGGHFFIDGDVDIKLPAGYGAGLHLRKAINYGLSLRGSVFYGKAKGLETQPYRHRNNTDINGIGGGLYEPVYNAYDPNTGGPGLWFPSYETTYIAAHLSAVFNIGNILFHQERNKWNWYASIGLGVDHHAAKLDLLDSSGLPYMDLVSRVNWTREEFDTQAGRDRIRNELMNIYDGIYETEGFKKAGVFRFGDDFNVHVVFVPSMGISRKISKRLNIGIEHKVFFSDNDYLDGIKYRTAVDQTSNLDVGHYTHLVIGINLGNFEHVTEPLYWMNPIDGAMDDIASMKAQPQLDLNDEDGDGVIDLLDREPDTKEDCPVDTRGVILDSDGDGIVDCEDKEPYSKPGCPVDEDGVSECGDTIDEDAINRMIEAKTEELRNSMILNTADEAYYRQGGEVTDASGSTSEREISGRNDAEGDNDMTPETGGVSKEPASQTDVDKVSPGNERESQDATQTPGTPGQHASGPYTTYVRTGCGDWFLPMIHFDLNKSVIKAEYYSHIHNVAQVMQKCADVCVVAQGHTDSRHSNEYNRVLSYKRAKAAVDHLVNNYGIDRERLKLMYGGEEQPMIEAPRSEIQHYMNRRVEFRTCESGDYDMAVPDGYNPDASVPKDNPKYYQGNKTSGY